MHLQYISGNNQRLQLVYKLPLSYAHLQWYTKIEVTSMSERILIVEDDPAISKLLDTNLTVAGYQVKLNPKK